MRLRYVFALCTASPFLAICASASELSYTFMDFQYGDKTVESSGVQFPVPVQSVDIVTDAGEGISIAGSLSIRDRFYVAGTFESSFVNLTATIENPFVLRVEEDDFDLIQTRVSFGYIQPIGANFDLIFEASYDTTNYDFGSLAGENFDIDDAGAGALVGFRWNPIPAFELAAAGRYTDIGTPLLDVREYDTDTLVQLGAMWHFFDDLALGLNLESGAVDTVTLSMRFEFGNLPW